MIYKKLILKLLYFVFLTGYEVHGIEKIPEGPGLIVYYHGATSVDYHFFVCNLYIQTGRVSYSVVDRALRMIPGLQLYLKLLTAVYEGREQCVEILKKGNLLGVAPGGARESFFSDENYGVLWGNRKGFAQVAIDAKVPIIPMYTENVREAYRSLRETSKIYCKFDSSVGNIKTHSIIALF
uniref:Transmembrane protein 68-like n=1 Tax=Terrapene triunguis TaxID=2587831 RepID=A0A674JBN0_9SAUR